MAFSPDSFFSTVYAAREVDRTWQECYIELENEVNY